MTVNPECPISLRAIVETVARRRKIPARHIYSRRRDKEISEARLIVYWLARELPGISAPVTGRLLGDRDHSTVLNGAKVIEARRLAEPELAAELDGLKFELSSAMRKQLGGLFDDPDPVSVAERIANSLDPVREGLRVSALEVAAMAVRLVDVEHIAAATFQLLDRCDRAMALKGADAAAFAAGTRQLIETLASALGALGYGSIDHEETNEEQERVNAH